MNTIKSYTFLLSILLISLILDGCGVLSEVGTRPTTYPSSKGSSSSSSTTEDSWDNSTTNESSELTISKPKADAIPTYLDEGVASWYGPTFHGKLTANGETYNMEDFTAAHRTLAFGTWVRVTNLENNKSVDVRVTDRGPYKKSRIIDLSKAAARQIDMIQNGTAHVRLEILDGPIPDLTNFCSICDSFSVQLGAFRNRFDAELKADAIKGAYIQEFENNGEMWYRVLFGKYDEKTDAEIALTRLQAKGVQGFVRQLENM